MIDPTAPPPSVSSAEIDAHPWETLEAVILKLPSAHIDDKFGVPGLGWGVNRTAVLLAIGAAKAAVEAETDRLRAQLTALQAEKEQLIVELKVVNDSAVAFIAEDGAIQDIREAARRCEEFRTRAIQAEDQLTASRQGIEALVEQLHRNAVPIEYPLGVSMHHTDVGITLEDMEAASSLSYCMGDLFLDSMKDAPLKQWRVVVRALRVHGLRIVEQRKLDELAALLALPQPQEHEADTETTDAKA